MSKKPRTIRMQITVALACALLLVLVATSVSYLALMELKEIIEEMSEESTMEGAPLLELLYSVRKSDLDGHKFLTYATDSSRKKYIDSSTRTSKAFETSLKSPFKDPTERESVRSAYIKWKLVNNLILSYSPNNDPAGKLKYMRKIDILVDDINKSLSKALNHTSIEMANLSRDAHIIWQRVSIFIVIIAASALVGFIVLWKMIVNSLTSPLNMLSRSVKAVGMGERIVELEDHADDELGRLVRAVNDMSDRVYESTASLKKLAEHDKLTGLLNHGALLKLLEEERARSLRYGRSFSFALLDIDHFKEINDTYGHLAGDEAIVQLASLVKDSIREADKVARYGGDEIAVVMPEIDGHRAIVLAERIRLSIASQHVVLPGGNMKALHVSIGVAEYPGDKDSVLDLISAADEALYDAKRKGRNKVCAEHWLKKRA